jgi:spore maturation protein CgeB
MKKAILINTKLIPCGGTHYLHTKKFLKCFEWFDYKFEEINETHQLDNIEDTEGTIIYLANFGWGNENYKQEIDILSKLKNVTFIFWLTIPEYCDNLLNNKILMLIKFYEKPPETYPHAVKEYEIQQNDPRCVTLYFGANVKPEDVEIKTDLENYVFDCNYVGDNYNESWTPYIQSNLKTFIRYTTRSGSFIPEEVRIDSFKKSLCSLGWQHEINKDCFLITERIFEALSYGCLLITDSKHIEREIEGGCVYVESKEDCVEKIRYYKNNIDEAREIINKGYEYIKQKGSYYYSCKLFLDKINEQKLNK